MSTSSEQNMQMQSMPRRHGRAFIAGLAVLAALGGGAWYLGVDPQDIRHSSPSDDLALRTPVASRMENADRSAPDTDSPVEKHQESGGPQIDAAAAAEAHVPPPETVRSEALTEEMRMKVSQETVALPLAADPVVRPVFADDLAAFMIEGFHPVSRSRGNVTIGLREVNMRYGMHLSGLRHKRKDMEGSRQAVLNYVFSASMVRPLYGMYADRFLQTIQQRLDLARYKGEAWGPALRADFFKKYAIAFDELAAILGDISSVSPERVREIVDRCRELDNSVATAESRYGTATFNLEDARRRGNGDVGRLEKHAAVTGDAYKNAVMKQAKTKHSLCDALRKSAPAGRMDDETVLFLANWVVRRIKDDSARFEAVGVAASCLKDLSQRFQLAASMAGEPVGMSSMPPAHE